MRRKVLNLKIWTRRSLFVSRSVFVSALCRLQGALWVFQELWIINSTLSSLPPPSKIPCHHYQVNGGRQKALSLHEFLPVSPTSAVRKRRWAADFSQLCHAPAERGERERVHRAWWLGHFWKVLTISTRKILHAPFKFLSVYHSDFFLIII